MAQTVGARSATTPHSLHVGPVLPVHRTKAPAQWHARKHARKHTHARRARARVAHAHARTHTHTQAVVHASAVFKQKHAIVNQKEEVSVTDWTVTDACARLRFSWKRVREPVEKAICQETCVDAICVCLARTVIRPLGPMDKASDS